MSEKRPVEELQHENKTYLALTLDRYRRALEEIRDYEMEQEDFVGIANVMQAIAEKALEEE